ncbi:MAG: leucine-rich repeat domain-containing protein [bacterium]|nr:leucine-rich repeat domain-containing protein [bacterium]
MHQEEQDTGSAGWQRINELIEQAAADGRREFSPGPEMKPEEWAQVTELPKSISTLKRVKHLILYGSSLVRIPPEIGEMTALKQFSPYTSYRLHWFPYEITRCKKLKDSTISTRALYGNYKDRAPFPRLPQDHPCVPQRCSVCEGSFGDTQPIQYWISLRIATDVVPLLVHACSRECIANLPKPPENYVQSPHQGGLGLGQPKADR